jgi:hypothetical protein
MVDMEHPHENIMRDGAAAVGPPSSGSAHIAAVAVFWFGGSRHQSALIILLECLSAATLIGLIAWHPASSLFKPLDFAPVRFYGRISYSFYLIHSLGILFAFRTLDPLTLDARGLPLSSAVIFTHPRLDPAHDDARLFVMAFHKDALHQIRQAVRQTTRSLGGRLVTLRTDRRCVTGFISRDLTTSGG